MLTKITRKVYDPDGQESVLGLPCTSVSEYWNGNINSDGIHIDDAFDINELNITDDHSTGVLSMIADIAKVQLQERNIPTAFTKPVIKGLPIKSDGTVDFDSDMVEDELEEVTLTTPITVSGIPVYKLWKSKNGNVSYMQGSSSVLMDNRDSMLNYTEGSAECVYKMLSSADAATLSTLLGTTISDGISIDPVSGLFDEYVELTTKSNYIFAVIAKKSMDSLCGLALVGIENVCFMSWMAQLHTQYPEISYANIFKAYTALPEMQWCFKDGKTCWLMSKDGSKIVLDYTVLSTDSFYARVKRFEAWTSNSSSNIVIISNEWDSNTIYVATSYNTNGNMNLVWNNNANSWGYLQGNAWKNAGEVREILVSNNKISDGYQTKNTGGVNSNKNSVTLINCSGKMGCDKMYFKGNDNKAKIFLVPSKNTNGDYCMFDLVSGTFFENQGTGSFSIEVIDD